MLLALSIRDVVLIEALDLDFARGLTVITGETGAGKSILLDALGLALGSRAATGLVRQGAAQASVTATFARSPAIDALLAEHGIDLEPGEPLIVRRTVRADGGSRAFAGDVAVSGALLRALGEPLVEIHGQHDDRGLLAPSGHRALLDLFGRCDTGPVSRAFAAMRAADTALATARDALANAEADRDWLTHAVAELDALGPEPGEEEALSVSRSAMQKGAKVADDLDAIDTLVSAADGGLSSCVRRRARSTGSPATTPCLPRRSRRSTARSSRDRSPKIIYAARERRWPSTRHGSRPRRRGCSSCARWRGNTASSPTRLPR